MLFLVHTKNRMGIENKAKKDRESPLTLTHSWVMDHICHLSCKPPTLSKSPKRALLLIWQIIMWSTVLLVDIGDFEATCFKNKLSNSSQVKSMGKFKTVCVFCGSKAGNRKIFSDAALDLGRELVERKMDLVYGGGSIGLMGLVSQTVYNGGCHVLGVIPTALVPHEISGEAVGQVLIVSNMHDRKAEMARRADAFIAIPGGYGTMEELLEIITWSQLGIHDKPVGLLNVDGYYDCLLGLFDRSVEEGFIKLSARNIVISEKTPKELIDRMEEYTPIHDPIASSKSWNGEASGITNS